MERIHELVQTTLGRALTLRWEDLKREDGQGATEYGLLIAFVVISIAVTVGLLGAAITGFLGRVAGELNNILPAP